MPISKVFHVENEAGLKAAAAEIAPILAGGRVLALEGPLGAGKTALARAVIRHLAGDPGLDVPSPTYTLVQTYETPAGMLWHFDLYRLKNTNDILELGWEDALAPGQMVLIEWPDRAGDFLPDKHLRAVMAMTGETGRRIEISE